MVQQIGDERITLQTVHTEWIDSGILSFGNQMQLIFGTAADNDTCKYMVHCINQLNAYMMSKYPNHRGKMRFLINDILSSINMAIQASAHIFSKTQLQSIQAAFMSGRTSKAIPYYEIPEEDKENEKEKKKIRHAI